MLWHGCIGNPRQYRRKGFALRLQEIIDKKPNKSQNNTMSERNAILQSKPYVNSDSLS